MTYYIDPYRNLRKLLAFSGIWLLISTGFQVITWVLFFKILGFEGEKAFFDWLFASPAYAPLYVSLTSIITYAIPVFVYAAVSRNSGTIKSLHANNAPALTLILLAAGTIVVSYPFIMMVFQFNMGLPIPEDWLKSEEQINQFSDKLMLVGNFKELAVTFLIGAIIPPICEELFFRGGLQPLLQKMFRNADMGIIMSAIFFSLMHGQPTGFIPRLILGIIFGYVYYWGRNIWLPILCHMVWNGSQIIIMYITAHQPADKVLTEPQKVPFYMSLISVALLFLIFKQFYTRAIVLKEAWRR